MSSSLVCVYEDQRTVYEKVMCELWSAHALEEKLFIGLASLTGGMDHGGDELSWAQEVVRNRGEEEQTSTLFMAWSRLVTMR